MVFMEDQGTLDFTGYDKLDIKANLNTKNLDLRLSLSNKDGVTEIILTNEQAEELAEVLKNEGL